MKKSPNVELKKKVWDTRISVEKKKTGARASGSRLEGGESDGAD